MPVSPAGLGHCPAPRPVHLYVSITTKCSPRSRHGGIVRCESPGKKSQRAVTPAVCLGTRLSPGRLCSAGRAPTARGTASRVVSTHPREQTLTRREAGREGPRGGRPPGNGGAGRRTGLTGLSFLVTPGKRVDPRLRAQEETQFLGGCVPQHHPIHSSLRPTCPTPVLTHRPLLTPAAHHHGHHAAQPPCLGFFPLGLIGP